MRHGDPERVSGDRHDHRVEVPIADHGLVGGRDQRVVRCGVQLLDDGFVEGGNEVAQGPVHLGHDPNRQRVLDRVRGSRFDQRSRRPGAVAGDPSPRSDRGSPWPWRRPGGGSTGWRRALPSMRAAATSESSATRRARATTRAAWPIDTAFDGDEGEAVLATRGEGFDAGAGERLAARQDLLPIRGTAHPHRNLRHPGQQRKVTCPHGPDTRHHRVHRVVQHRDEDISGGRGGARPASGQAVKACRQGRPHQRHGHGRSYAATVRHDQEHLLAVNLLVGESGVPPVADLGGEPVHGVVRRERWSTTARELAMRARTVSSISTCAPWTTARRSSRDIGSSVIVTVVMLDLPTVRFCRQATGVPTPLAPRAACQRRMETH